MGKWDRVKSGGTMISITEDGTNWGDGYKRSARSRKKEPAAPLLDRSPRAQAVRAQELMELQEGERNRATIAKLTRSFVGDCVQPWLDGKLTDKLPRPPQLLAASIKEAGGTTRWIARSAERRTLFHRAVCRKVGREVPFAQLWGKARGSSSAL